VAAGFDPQRFRLVPYGAINEAAVEVKTPLIQEIIQTAPQYRNLVFAGGGVEIKGAPVLLKAIPLLLQKVPNLRVLVAGVGEERYINLYKQYAPQVQFLGRVEFTEMRNLFASADLALVASTWFENSPVVIYENFQVGTPVVGSAFGGIPELIDEDQTGYLFPVGDARALAEKVAHHFNKPAYVRRQMGHRCLKKAQEELTMENHLAGIEQVYREVWQNSDVPNGVTPHEN
jgi:glycosyltransferase involved in cell wall biosynthesis